MIRQTAAAALLALAACATEPAPALGRFVLLEARSANPSTTPTLRADLIFGPGDTFTLRELVGYPALAIVIESHGRAVVDAGFVELRFSGLVMTALPDVVLAERHGREIRINQPPFRWTFTRAPEDR